MRYTLVDAFEKLVDPNAQWGFANGDRYENLIWMSDSYTQPTEEECVQKLAELNYEYEVNEYQNSVLLSILLMQISLIKSSMMVLMLGRQQS